MTLDIIALVLLALTALAGVVLTALQLPGTWLILASGVAYDWCYDWAPISWQWLVALAVVAAVAEVLDSVAALAAAHRAGASRRAAVGSLLGGFLGMILFSIPVPVVGTIVGGLIGCFLGALVGELTVRDELKAGARVGLFAALGRLVGLVAKTAAAVVLAGAVVSLAIRAMW